MDYLRITRQLPQSAENYTSRIVTGGELSYTGPTWNPGAAGSSGQANPRVATGPTSRLFAKRKRKRKQRRQLTELEVLQKYGITPGLPGCTTDSDCAELWKDLDTSDPAMRDYNREEVYRRILSRPPEPIPYDVETLEQGVPRGPLAVLVRAIAKVVPRKTPTRPRPWQPRRAPTRRTNPAAPPGRGPGRRPVRRRERGPRVTPGQPVIPVPGPMFPNLPGNPPAPARVSPPRRSPTPAPISPPAPAPLPGSPGEPPPGVSPNEPMPMPAPTPTRAPEPKPNAPGSPRPAPRPASPGRPKPATSPAPRTRPLTRPSWWPSAVPFPGTRLVTRPATRPLTSLQPRGVSSSQLQPSPGPSTLQDQCRELERQRRRRRKRKPRTVCYRGTYRELSNGLIKRRKEKVPCRPSRKKPQLQLVR